MASDGLDASVPGFVVPPVEMEESVRQAGERDVALVSEFQLCQHTRRAINHSVLNCSIVLTIPPSINSERPLRIHSRRTLQFFGPTLYAAPRPQAIINNPYFRRINVRPVPRRMCAPQGRTMGCLHSRHRWRYRKFRISSCKKRYGPAI